MKLSEKAAYLKGLADGMNIGEETPNDKLIGKLLDLVSEMAGTIELLEDRCDELTDYADELDADLGDVEEYLFSDDDDCCDCDCESCVASEADLDVEIPDSDTEATDEEVSEEE